MFWPVEPITPRDWLAYARMYGQACSALDDPPCTHALPRVQLAGHAIECALKCYLTYKQVPLPQGSTGHDIFALGLLAEEHGCLVTELEAIAIYQASLLYFQGAGSGDRYASRYPTGRQKPPKSIVGSFQKIEEFIESVARQVAQTSAQTIGSVNSTSNSLLKNPLNNDRDVMS